MHILCVLNIFNRIYNGGIYMNKKKITYKQKLDLSLYCLWNEVENLKHNPNFSNKINRKINELCDFIEEELFEKMPDNYDIVDEESYLIYYLEEFKK